MFITRLAHFTHSNRIRAKKMYLLFSMCLNVVLTIDLFATHSDPGDPAERHVSTLHAFNPFDVNASQSDLRIAIKEFQLFCIEELKEYRVSIICNEFKIIQCNELWSLDNKPFLPQRVVDLASLSSDGRLFIVFNPTSGNIEVHDIDSRSLIRELPLNLNTAKGDKFETISNVTGEYVAYAIKRGFVLGPNSSSSYPLTYTKRQLFLLNLTDYSNNELSDKAFTGTEIAEVRRKGSNHVNWADDSNKIYLFSSRTLPKHSNFFDLPSSDNPTHVWEFDLNSKVKKKLYTLPNSYTGLTFNPKGQLIFGEKYINGNQSFFEFDADVMERSVYSVTSDCLDDYEVIDTNPVEKSLVLLDRRNRDKKIPLLYDWSGKLPIFKEILPETETNRLGEISNVIHYYDENGRSKCVYLTKAGRRRIHATEESDPIAITELQKIADKEGGEIRLISVSENLRRIIYTTKGPGLPPTLRVFDIDAKARAIRETFSYTPKIPGHVATSKLSTPLAINIPSGEFTMPGFLVSRHGDKSSGMPAVMLIHGGPHACDKFTFDPMAQFLASRGMAVLHVNYPGSTGFGRAYENASNGNWDKVVEHIHNARNYLVSVHGIDPEKIAIVGGSFGAYVAVASIQRYPNDYKCAVAYNGIYDLPLEMENNTPDANRLDVSRQFTGRSTPTESHEELMIRLSPALNRKPIVPPLLLLHATADTTCPLAQAESLVGKHPEMDVRYGVFEGDGHNLNNEHNHVLAALMEQFFCKYFRTFATPLGKLLEKIPTFRFIDTSRKRRGM